MIPEWFPLIFLLLGVGAASGLTAGLFGVGGGSIMVPALFFAFTVTGVPGDIVMHMAVATSSAVIVINSIKSVRAHQAKNSVDWDILWPKPFWQSYAMWIAIGAFIAAAFIAPYLSTFVLTVLFFIVAMIVAAQFMFGRPDFTLRDNVPGGAARPIVGGGVGIVSALMGIGGGSLTVPLMTLCSVPIHRAVGTASGLGLAIAAPATLGFIISGWGAAGRWPFSLGYVNGLAFAAMVAAAFVTVPLGAKLAHKMSQPLLKKVFGVGLLIVALNMLRQAMLG